MTADIRTRLPAVVALRCPVCLDGSMYRSLFRMHDRCPRCGHRFEREPGFFQGAMYVSYTLACGILAVLAFVGLFVLAPRIGAGPAFAVAVAIHFALVPILWRYSRVVWAHLNVGTRQ